MIRKQNISCSLCKAKKPRSDFYNCKSRSTKVSSQCKECDKKRDYRKHKVYKLHKKCLALLGNKCVKCGFSDIRALQIDHVNGGGKKELKSLRGQWRNLYRMVLIDKTGKYQCLCANCNWIKRYENEEGLKL